MKKNDFIELEFIGKEKNGEVFDTNIPSEAKKIGLEIDNKNFVICVGQKMVVVGLDNALENKETGKKYSVTLEAKEAFGLRKRDLVRLIPLKIFTEKNIQPRPGMTLALDNALVKIASVSGGRVLVDFNNPLAGKEITYEFTIKNRVSDSKEKINSLLDYFLKQRPEFTIKEKKAIFSLKDPMFEHAINMLNEKFKDIIGLELVIEKKKEETETIKKTQ